VARDCPNCGASLRDDGTRDLVVCHFCGTHVTLPKRRPALSRRELELERAQIVAREQEWAARVKEAEARGPQDYLVPPIGCCGIYVAVFVVGSLILSAIGMSASKQHGNGIAILAIVTALAGLGLIVWRRNVQRRKRIAALESAWTADRHLREERLREIEADLAALGG
jgi:uncharacterized Zn finger protein (UPF0148 family)